MTIALLIGGVWLFAVLHIGNAHARFQRLFPTLEQCEQAKADLLRRYPGSFVVCDSGG